MAIKLSQIKTDFFDIREQFQLFLGRFQSWKDKLISSTGQMVIDFVSGVADTALYSIERAVQEVFLETANAPVSVYSCSRLLGVRVQRFQSAKVPVTLSSPNLSLSYLIPAFSAFTVGEFTFFNPEPIVINIGDASVVATLYEGTEVDYTFVATGEIFKQYFVSTDFIASDQYVRVLINNVEWTRTQNGLWQFGPDEKGYYETTTQDGQVEIRFGNNINGRAPSIGDTIVVKTYETIGIAANVSLGNLPVACLFDTTIRGITTDAITGGNTVPDLDAYRLLTPKLFAAGNRGVTRADITAIVDRYSTVIDCKAIGEAELGPGNPAYQNVIGLVILVGQTNANGVVSVFTWTTQQKADFLVWYDQYRISTTKVLFLTPTAITQNISANLLIDQNYNVNSIVQTAKKAVSDYYQPKLGALGRKFYLSDVYKILNSVTGVLHVDVTLPTVDTDISYQQYFSLGSVSVTGQYIH